MANEDRITLTWTTMGAVDDRATIENRDRPCLYARQGDRFAMVPYTPGMRDDHLLEERIVVDAIRALRIGR